MRVEQGARRRIIAFILSVAVVNTLLALPMWTVTGGAAPFFVVWPTSAALALLALTSVPTGPGRRWIRVAVGMAVGYVVGFAVAEAGIQFIYARPFVPRLDIPMVRSLVQLTLGPIGSGADVIGFVTIAVVFVLFFAFGIAMVGVCTWGAAGVGVGSRSVWNWRRVMVGAAVVLASVVTIAGASDGTGTTPMVVPRAIGAWFERTELTVRAIPGVPSRSVPTRSVPSWSVPSWSVPQTAEDFTPELLPAAAVGSPSVQPTVDPGVNPGVDPGIDSGIDSGVDTAYVFPGILDRDIYIFAVEAYGYATVSQEVISRELGPVRAGLESALRAAGYDVATSYLRSPVAGGFSWLAEATFLTGQWIDSQADFEELYDAGLPTLTGVLQQGGYHTFTVRPGTVHASWPEGWDLYRFEEALVAHDGDFRYRGPWFSYVAVTDQFALWRAHEYLQTATAPGGVAETRPILAHYQLVSSHTPFNRIPPVIDDWNDLGDGRVYHERAEEIAVFDNSWTGGSQLIEGYTAAVAYVFRTITKYVREQMDHRRSPIIVILGDHQAQRPIREQNAHLSVPIHIATRDPAILRRFIQRGFQRGMVGDEPPPHRPMSEFFPLFLEVARGGEAVPASGGAAPLSGEVIPASGGAAPVSGEAAPASVGAAPLSGEAIPASDRPTSAGDDAIR